MIDMTTRKPISVETDGGAEPYITLPESQLDEVTRILDANKVPYWVAEDVISIDGKPEIAEINLSYRCDPVMVQRLLDSLA